MIAGLSPWLQHLLTTHWGMKRLNRQNEITSRFHLIVFPLSKEHQMNRVNARLLAFLFYRCYVYVCVCAGVGEVGADAPRTQSSNGSRVCKTEALGYWFKPFLPPPLGAGARGGEIELKSFKLKLDAWIFLHPKWSDCLCSFSCCLQLVQKYKRQEDWRLSEMLKKCADTHKALQKPGSGNNHHKIKARQLCVTHQILLIPKDVWVILKSYL